LPIGDITAIAKASDGAVWYGTAQGVVRADPKSGRNQYFAGMRYLPDDDVVQLAADSSAGMWILTRTGVSHIELRPMTLASKAAIFEKRSVQSDARRRQRRAMDLSLCCR
jgi:ligand-binding sensor domain-containing protein